MKPEEFGIPMIRTCRCVNTYCSHHQALRAMWIMAVATGTVECWRCGNLIRPDEQWDLGHRDGDPSRYAGPETWSCNRSTSTRKAERKHNEHARRWIL